MSASMREQYPEYTTPILPDLELVEPEPRPEPRPEPIQRSLRWPRLWKCLRIFLYLLLTFAFAFLLLLLRSDPLKLRTIDFLENQGYLQPPTTNISMEPVNSSLATDLFALQKMRQESIDITNSQLAILQSRIFVDNALWKKHAPYVILHNHNELIQDLQHMSSAFPPLRTDELLADLRDLVRSIASSREEARAKLILLEFWELPVFRHLLALKESLAFSRWPDFQALVAFSKWPGFKALLSYTPSASLNQSLASPKQASSAKPLDTVEHPLPNAVEHPPPDTVEHLLPNAPPSHKTPEPASPLRPLLTHLHTLHTTLTTHQSRLLRLHDHAHQLLFEPIYHVGSHSTVPPVSLYNLSTGNWKGVDFAGTGLAQLLERFGEGGERQERILEGAVRVVEGWVGRVGGWGQGLGVV